MNELQSSVRMRSILLILFGVVWVIFFGILFFVELGMVRNQPPGGGLDPSILVVLIIAAFGPGIIAVGLFPMIAWLRVTRPEITIDKTDLALGDRFTVSYSQVFKKRSEVRGIQLSLVMRESARYQSGKNSHVVHHEVMVGEINRPGQPYEAGDTLAFSQIIGIPRSGMHTFHAAHNSIDWQLRVKVDIAGWPDYGDAFDLQVRPSPGSLRAP
jgi:hypothetical protein